VSTINPIIQNGKIISINAIYGRNSEYQIQFKDSYLLLPNSLMSLGKAFGVSCVKSMFPFLFVNENNLDYIGEVPNKNFFKKDLSLKDYNEYKIKFSGN
jgi:hypothetical protein